jgi:DUF1009 family protein
MPPKSEQSMHESEVRLVVSEVLAEQKRLHTDQIDDVVLKTVVNLLTSFGFEEEDRKELRADFTHLRKWRKSVDAATGLTFKVVIGTIVSGFLAALYMGLKGILGK